MTKIGIYGGSFNPFHSGHYVTGIDLINQNIIDELVYMPTFCNPWKINNDNIDSYHRFCMIDSFLKKRHEYGFIKNVSCSNFEIVNFYKEECAYSVDVLQKYIYTNMSSDKEYYFIIGADVFNNITRFKNYNWLLESGVIKIIVLTRPGYEVCKVGINTKNCIFVDVPELNISSSEIREKVRNGEDITELVPKEIKEYITEHNLYK